MKRWIARTEWYPIYVLEEEEVPNVQMSIYPRFRPHRPPIELKEEEFRDYEEIQRRFDEWQDRLSDAFEEEKR